FGRLFHFLGILVLVYMLLQTGSRAALLGTLAALSILCLVHVDRRIAAVFLVAAVFVSARLLAEPGLLARVSKQYLYKHEQGQADILQSRLQPWKAAEKNFRKNPWLGLGFGITSKAESGWSLEMRSTGAMETGNGYLSSLVQVGIIGSAPLFLALALLLIGAGRFAWKVSDPWFTSIYGSTLALAINAAFEGWLIAPGNFVATYFWMQCFFLNALICRFRPATAHSVSFQISQTEGLWARG
ncbi:MAG: O-antigen ligase family protein, partial [Acidobacteria bacterium]|nr:O-antigen ligase family protein [Acidobacteriota bacterium]